MPAPDMQAEEGLTQFPADQYQNIAHDVAQVVGDVLHVATAVSHLAQTRQPLKAGAQANCGPVVVGAITGIVDFVARSPGITDDQIRDLFLKSINHVLPQIRAEQAMPGAPQGTA